MCHLQRGREVLHDLIIKPAVMVGAQGLWYPVSATHLRVKEITAGSSIGIVNSLSFSPSGQPVHSNL